MKTLFTISTILIFTFISFIYCVVLGGLFFKDILILKVISNDIIIINICLLSGCLGLFGYLTLLKRGK